MREQVLALEREFQVKLIEPHRRGCRLTEDGRLLAEIATPIMTAAGALKRRFDVERRECRSSADGRRAAARHSRRHPEATIALLKISRVCVWRFYELHDDLVIQAVESGAADLGLTSEQAPDQPPPGLSIERGYELETLLVTPKNHPLAHKRRVTPADLRRYPLITSRHSLSDQPALAANLERNQVFDGPPPRVEPFLASTVRTYVQLNFGIALIYGLPPARRNTHFHERSMSEYFGRRECGSCFDVERRMKSLRMPISNGFGNTMCLSGQKISDDCRQSPIVQRFLATYKCSNHWQWSFDR